MPRLIRLLLTVSLPLFLLDYLTKEWTVQRFLDPAAGIQEQITVVPGFFDLVRVHNTGVAFGTGNGGAHSNYIFGGISLLALCFIGWMWKKNAFPTRLSRLAVVLLVSGVLGNLLDRFLRGYVVDFLHFHITMNGEIHSWPAFNVADSCICIAAVFLFISAWQKPVSSDPTPPT